ncbi:MAG: YCF48-related protein [Bryobacteraceae bacterium]
MLKSTNLAKAIAPFAILLLPALASAQAPAQASAPTALQGEGCWLRDAVSPTPMVVYSLCQQGMIYATTDGGATWNSRSTGATVFVRAMVFNDVNHGLIAGDEGTILATGDGGKTWQPRISKTKEHLLSITSVGSDVWASGFDGVIVHSGDGGSAWETEDSGTTQTLQDIFFIDKDHGWAAGWSGTIIRTVDGGKKWQASPSKAQWSLMSMHFTDVNNGWIVGFSGQLLRTKDGGATWELLPPPTKEWLKDVAVDRSGRIWLVADAQLLVSEDGGAKWRSVPMVTQAFLRELFPVGDSLWAIGQLGMIKQVGTEWKPVDALKILSASDAKAAAARKDIASQAQAAPAKAPAKKN